MPLRLHIGFDFWGAGNLGDDLMLAGFLGWLKVHAPDAQVSALCGHDLAAMRLRFPEITWHASDPASRSAALEGADAWLGLGGSPFQSDLGPWLLDQMCANMQEARQRDIPCFLVGVGLNNREAFQTEPARQAVALARRIWVRDAYCHRSALEAGLPASLVRHGADLAHLGCAGRTPTLRPGSASFVIHTAASSVSSEAIQQAVDAVPAAWDWVCQESRPLADSEILLHQALDPKLRDRLPLLTLDYGKASLDEVFAHCQGWDLVLSSRYHSSLAAAWAGSRLCIYERNHKLEGIREELGVPACPSLSDPQPLIGALKAAHPVSRERLKACHARAHAMLSELMNELRPKPWWKRLLPL